MPAPTASSSTSVVAASYDAQIDALLSLVKWGGGAGSGAAVSFSFPWTSSASATFAGYNGAPYSALGEDTAASHAGLDSTQMAAARAALQSWASVANVWFTEVADTSTNVGDIRFAWTSATKTGAGMSQPWGWGGYPDAYWPSGADVWISTQSTAATDPDWSPGSYNYDALIHETGHALGLKHSFDGVPVLPAALDTRQYSVMAYADAAHSLFVELQHNANGTVSWHSYTVLPETPMLLDIAAIQYLYGANLAWRTGSDVYTFDPSHPFLKTIWDAGGDDTISVANFSRGCTIDLRAGHYSSITILSDSTAGYNWSAPPPVPTYDGTDNLAIAYGCTIENATGGAGNDVLQGNEVANRLNGGPGDDKMYGAAGDDVFILAAGDGNDLIDGGDGSDTAVFDGDSWAYAVTAGGGGFTIAGAAGTDFLTGVEFAQFADRRIALQPDFTVLKPVGFSAAGGATGIAVGSNLAVAFNEPIQRGDGAIVLRTIDGTPVASYDAATSANLSLSGSTLVIDPASDLAPGTTYVIEFGAGSLRGAAGDTLAGGATQFSTTASGGTYTGAAGSDMLSGSAGSDTFHGNGGADVFAITAGNDFIDGGAGLDTVRYNGPRSAFTVSQAPVGFTVSGPEGTDSLVNIERLQFGDMQVALDANGAGGQAYRLYQAAFDRAPDGVGLGYWIKVLDGGASLRDVAGGFVNSGEFRTVYGAAPTNDQLVAGYYQHVLHRAPDAGGYAYWVGVLDQRLDTAAGVLMNISESPENHAGVIGAIANGFDYTPYP